MLKARWREEAETAAGASTTTSSRWSTLVVPPSQDRRGRPPDGRRVRTGRTSPGGPGRAGTAVDIVAPRTGKTFSLDAARQARGSRPATAYSDARVDRRRSEAGLAGTRQLARSSTMRPSTAARSCSSATRSSCPRSTQVDCWPSSIVGCPRSDLPRTTAARPGRDPSTRPASPWRRRTGVVDLRRSRSHRRHELHAVRQAM